MSIAGLVSSGASPGRKEGRVDSARKLARHGAFALGVYLVGHGLAFVTQLALARVLGAAAFGIYALVMAWIVALVYVAMLGQSIAMLRFVPQYLACGRLDMVRGVVGFGERRVAVASISLACAVVLTGIGLQARFGSAVAYAFVAGAPLIPLIALTTVRCSIVRAYGGVVAALVPLRIVRDLTIFAAVLWLALGSVADVSAVAALCANVGGAVLALVAATFMLRALQPEGLARVTPATEPETWRAAAWPLLVMTACEALFDKSSVIVLGAVEGSGRAGVLALALSISMLVVLPRTAIDTLLAPEIARLHAQQRERELRFVLVRASLIGFAAGAGIAVALLIVARPVLAWFGPGFAQGGAALAILVAAQIFAAASGPQLTVMAMTGRETQAARLLVASTLAALVFSTALAIPFGLTGAAAGAALAIVVWNVLMARDLWRTGRLIAGLAGGLRIGRENAVRAAARNV